MTAALDTVLRLSDRVVALPVVHGSGDCAIAVRRYLLNHRFDCLAVPLPPSFQAAVETAIGHLPTPLLVAQPDRARFQDWEPRFSAADDDEDDDEDVDDDDPREVSYVPIDPCQAVIAALRIAQQEHCARAFIDLETSRYEPCSAVLPDPYALKRVELARFAAAILPSIPPPPAGQPAARVVHMAHRLRELEQHHEAIVLVCSVLDWPWIRDAFRELPAPLAGDDEVEEPTTYQPEAATLFFMLGELPFITGLYERARAELEDDENLSVDGVKELLLTARQRYRDDLGQRARKITPHLLRLCLKYIRNLSLLERRFTPDLYTIAVAAKQLAGDQYALHAVETARDYPLAGETPFDSIRLGVERARLPDGELVSLVSRLPGSPVVWRSLQLQRRPERQERQRWQTQWNPFQQCSWPPEDEAIESFRSHVFDRARQVMGADLARTEKFTTSVEDGIDIRDTLRHWYEGEIYVKVLPPNVGSLDCVVMLFDSPADPRDYPWRSTWYAEHREESTLGFYATDFTREMVGPGICQATYGGVLFLFPPLGIPDIWHDPRLEFATTLEERLLGAACLHSRERQIALVSPGPPGAAWRRLARRFHRRWVHLPLSQFSDATIQQLRILHVLNGKEVRSYAERFIRKA